MRESLEQQLNTLKQRLAELNDLKSAAAVLSWDQATYMPGGGAVARARQLATLSKLTHQKATNVELGRLLVRLLSHSGSLPDREASLVRIAYRDFEKADKVPSEFVARVSALRTRACA